MELTADAADDALPEGPELEAARQEIRDRAAEARQRWEKLDKRLGDPATMHDLLDLRNMIWEEFMDFTILHVKRRAVLREDVAADAVKQVAPTWRGTWQPEISYAKGVLVNDKSALWVSERPTASRPGAPGSGWKLCIKSPNR